ncbi:hypothetical protein [Streptomyces sp. SBT349]|uniref:hypothetical protein n=1 Tax=Streptomyces sp. SBT349 TaxID=1580539 RepID=UPI00066B855B|nr:hypothetical protein [Streptomyces sp. SBT349]
MTVSLLGFLKPLLPDAFDRIALPAEIRQLLDHLSTDLPLPAGPASAPLSGEVRACAHDAFGGFAGLTIDPLGRAIPFRLRLTGPPDAPTGFQLDLEPADGPLVIRIEGAVERPARQGILGLDTPAPRPVPTSPMLLWTGHRDATGQAELALRWPPSPGAARYRVHLGDARRLADELGLSLADTPVLAARAHPIHVAADRLTGTGAFTFLGEAAGAPAGDGFIHFTARVPGGPRGVQFVRVVPVAAGGAEPAFHTCGLVPLAVPGTDRPPPPLLDAFTDPAHGPTLRVRARGLRPELLAAAPGGAPEFRLRGSARGADRHVALVRTSGDLTGPDAEGAWTATVPLSATAPDPVWHAEVRYPAEPALPPGTAASPADGGVEPVWGAVGDGCEGLWSDPSPAWISANAH